MALPTFSSKGFNWKKGHGSSTEVRLNTKLDRLGRGFYIKSEKTGVLQLFLYDAEENERNEFFDGEAKAYMSPGAFHKVTIYVGDF